MEKDNKKARDKGKKAYNDQIRHLVEIVKKRDKRVTEHLLKVKKEQEEAEKAAALKKQVMEKERQAAMARMREEQERAYDELDAELEARETEDADYQSPYHQNEEEEQKKNEVYCAACKKLFKSDRQWKSHERSKKHQQAVEALAEELMAFDNEAEGEDAEGAEEYDEENAEGAVEEGDEDELAEYDEDGNVIEYEVDEEGAYVEDDGEGEDENEDENGDENEDENEDENGDENGDEADAEAEADEDVADEDTGDVEGEDEGQDENGVVAENNGEDGESGEKDVGAGGEDTGSEPQVQAPRESDQKRPLTKKARREAKKAAAAVTQAGQAAPPTSGKRWAKENRTPAAKQTVAPGAAGANPTHECGVCGQKFLARNALFAHLKEMDHAQPLNEVKRKTKRTNRRMWEEEK